MRSRAQLRLLLPPGLPLSDAREDDARRHFAKRLQAPLLRLRFLIAAPDGEDFRNLLVTGRHRIATGLRDAAKAALPRHRPVAVGIGGDAQTLGKRIGIAGLAQRPQGVIAIAALGIALDKLKDEALNRALADVEAGE